MNRRHLFRIGAVAASLTAIARGADTEPTVEGTYLTPDSYFVFNFETETMVATNGATVKYLDSKGEESTLTANWIRYNPASGEAEAGGTATLRQGAQVWTGDLIDYNFKSKVMKTGAFRTGASPFFASGAGLTLNQTNNTYSATNAVITTDDVAEPGYRIKARSLKIVPGKSFEARDATLYLGKTPIMYFPFYRRNLTRHPNNWVLAPGYRSLYGPYLQTRYNWYASDKLSGGIDLDLMQKRGVGVGPEISYDLGKLGQGNAQYYFLHDGDPGVDLLGKPIDDDRQRLKFHHQTTLRTNLTVKIVGNGESDAYVRRDFFESEYRQDLQPKSYLEVNQLWNNFSLDVLAMPRVNTFFETIERLPDVKLSALRQQLGVSPIYYEGENSIGYFRYKFANDTTPDYAAMRADSYHQLILPKTLFGWLNLTPRVGGRFTHYGETDGRGLSINEQDRWVFNTGAEVSTKISRTWTGTKSKFWNVNGIRHIIEPSANYVFVPEPQQRPPQLPQFDRELYSYRLLPIDYPDYTAIDSVDSQNVIRWGLRNRVQTKRKDGLDDMLNWALYTDWRLKPRATQTTYADIYSDISLKPRTWLTFTSETRYGTNNEELREANHFVTLQPGTDWSVSLGHRYLKDDPTLPVPYNEGNNLIASCIYYKLNENWAVRLSHHFEAKDGKMEEQYYTIYRDMRSWTSALTFRLRESRGGKDDFTVALTFSLKAFPSFSKDADLDYPGMLTSNR